MGECDGVTTQAGPFQLGSDIWPGLGKVIEESTELGTVLGKLIATGGSYEYWEGVNLRRRVTEELADVMAAVTFFIDRNGLDKGEIANRSVDKLALYQRWATNKAG